VGGAAVNTSGSQSGVHNAYSVAAKKFGVESNSVISTFAGGVNLYPGDVAGTEATGGRYI